MILTIVYNTLDYRVLYFVHRPVFQKTQALLLWLALSNGSNRGCASHPSPEGGNRSNFRNIAFYVFLEYWMIDEVQRTSHKKLRGFSPQANYTDRAIAAGQRS
jgi:hypothetical protein